MRIGFGIVVFVFVMAAVGQCTPMLSFATTPRVATLEVIEPSKWQYHEFRSRTPCPYTDSIDGPCPIYQVAFIVPRCAGGDWSWKNMAWFHGDVVRARLPLEQAYCSCLKTVGSNQCPAVDWTWGVVKNEAE